MSLEISGKITNVLEPITGTSAKGDWKKQTYVLIESEGQYPKSIAFDSFNKDFNLKVGDEVKVSINIESREFNGKYYTNVNAWKVDTGGSGQPDNKTVSEVPEPSEEDQLPF